MCQALQQVPSPHAEAIRRYQNLPFTCLSVVPNMPTANQGLWGSWAGQWSKSSGPMRDNAIALARATVKREGTWMRRMAIWLGVRLGAAIASVLFSHLGQGRGRGLYSRHLVKAC